MAAGEGLGGLTTIPTFPTPQGKCRVRKMTAELWVEVVKALAWPVTEVALIISFKKYLLAAAAQVGRIRYGDFEAEFEMVITSAPERQPAAAEPGTTPATPTIDAELARKLEDLALTEA